MQDSAPGRPPHGSPDSLRTSDNVIDVRDLTHSFPTPTGYETEVLTNISMTVGKGQFVAIVGPSGCGKTTLMNIVAGLEAPQTGSVEVRGAIPYSGQTGVGYLFARDALLPWRTALGNAEFAMELRKVPKRERRQRAMTALDDVGLGAATERYRAELSQGMRQRVALARTWAAEPDLILMDEPFSALDAQTKLTLQDKFMRLWERRSASALLITHDLAEAIALADKVLVMTRSPGRVKSIHEIDISRPRSVLALQQDHRYHKYLELIWSDLRDEVNE